MIINTNKFTIFAKINIMNDEKFVKYLNKCINDYNKSIHSYIIPAKGDPTLKQNEYSLMVMKEVKKGLKPKLIIDIKKHQKNK